MDGQRSTLMRAVLEFIAAAQLCRERSQRQFHGSSPRRCSNYVGETFVSYTSQRLNVFVSARKHSIASRAQGIFTTLWEDPVRSGRECHRKALPCNFNLAQRHPGRLHQGRAEQLVGHHFTLAPSLHGFPSQLRSVFVGATHLELRARWVHRKTFVDMVNSFTQQTGRRRA